MPVMNDEFEVKHVPLLKEWTFDRVRKELEDLYDACYKFGFAITGDTAGGMPRHLINSNEKWKEMLESGSEVRLYLRRHAFEGIGHGSFGIVYGVREYKEATASTPRGKDDFDFAVKEIAITKKAELVSSLKECDLLESLQHDNIVRCLGHWVSGNNLYIKMEHVPSQLTDTPKGGGRWPEATVREFATQILSGLKYLHDHRVVHRDIKVYSVSLFRPPL